MTDSHGNSPEDPDGSNPAEEGPDLSGFADMVARDLASLSLAPFPVTAYDFEDGDEDDPDPGCVHPWYRLDFMSDAPGLGCSRCGQGWLLEDEEDAQDGLLVVWQAARHEFERLAHRHEALAAVVESLSGLRRCCVCETWAAPETFANLDAFSACPEHIGAALSSSSDPASWFTPAASWLVDNGFIGSVNPTAQWSVETSILDFPPLGEALGRPDEQVPDVVISVRKAVAEKLGIGQQTTVREAGLAFASKLALDEPSARPSWVFLLGVLAHANAADAVGKPVMVEAALEATTPIHGTQRAIIVMDLCRSDMPEEGTFTGDMADDLVGSLGTRAFELLA